MAGTPITDIDRKIARRLRTRRKLFGISAQRIAFAISRSTDDYLKYEAAEMPIPPAVLDELAYLLNVPARYFSTGGSADC